MAFNTLPGRPAIADLNGAVTLIKGGVGKIYAETDTALANPLTVYSLTEQVIPTLNSNSVGMIPDAKVSDQYEAVIWHDPLTDARIWLPTKEAYKGLTAYQVAQRNGFAGTEADWLESLKEPAVTAAGTATAAASEASNVAQDLINRRDAGEFEGAPGKDGSNVLPMQAAVLQELQSDPVKAELSATTAEAIARVSADTRAAVLAPAHAALAGRSYSPASILVLGDSFGEGWGASSPPERWVSRFLDALRTAYPTAGVAGGRGYIPAAFRGYVAEPWKTPTTYNLGRGYSAGATTPRTTYGLGTYSFEIGPATETLSKGFVRFEMPGTMTSFDLCYRQISADATLEIAINGTVVQTIAATPLGEQTARVTLAARGNPDIRVYHGAGGPVVIEGIMAYDGDETKGIHLWNGSLSGSKADQFTTGVWSDALPRTSADLVILAWGTNDYGAVTSAAYKTAMQGIITHVRAKLPNVPVLLAPPWRKTGTFAEPWENYKTALRELAETQTGVAVADMDARQPSTTGLLVDGLHPNDIGHAQLAGQYARLLTA